MNMTTLLAAVDGKKTYIALVVGMIAVFLNHVGFWPNAIIPLQLDPNTWTSDEYKLILGLVTRSAIAKAAT